MKKFFEEYGSVAIIVIVIAVLLLIVGSVKGLDEVTGKVNGFGVASIVGNAYAKAINKFDESFDNTLNGADPSKEIAKKLGLNRFGITSIKQTCSDKYSYNRGELVGYNIEYQVRTYSFASYARPALHVISYSNRLYFAEADYDVDSEKSINLNRSGNLFAKKKGDSSFLNGDDSRDFLNKISYTNSCLEIVNRNGVPIYFSNDDTGFSCYALDGEWHILNEGK